MRRWVAVLSAFATGDTWGVRQLADYTQLPKSVVHRLLHQMSDAGLLAAATRPGEFRVGPVLTRISVLVSGRLDVVRVARPFLQQAVAEAGETTILALYVPSYGKFWAVEAVESAHTIRYLWEALRELSELHIGSSGKGILAFLPQEEQEAILARLSDPLPGRQSTTKDELRAELAEIRRAGCALTHGERFPGAVGVSAPIRDAERKVIGDVIICWPDNRTSALLERRRSCVVRRVASDLSHALGYLEE